MCLYWLSLSASADAGLNDMTCRSQQHVHAEALRSGQLYFATWSGMSRRNVSLSMCILSSDDNTEVKLC